MVSDKIVTGVCFVEAENIKIQNKFPHITIMTGSWPAKMGNLAMDKIFGWCAPLETVYQERFKEKGVARKVEIEEKKGVKVTAYVYVLEKPLVLKGVTRKYPF